LIQISTYNNTKANYSKIKTNFKRAKNTKNIHTPNMVKNNKLNETMSFELSDPKINRLDRPAVQII